MLTLQIGGNRRLCPFSVCCGGNLIKMLRAFTCSIMRNLPVARARCSKMFCHE